MSPWTVLAWLLLAVIYVALSLALWMAGKYWGWPDWLAPAVGVGLPVVALLFAIIRRLLSPPAETPPVAAGMQSVTPAMAAMMPPREIAKRWQDFLPLLGNEKKEIFLAMGETDAFRNRLWLSIPECRYLRDDVSGLAFAVFRESLWIDVPASFVTPPSSAADAPLQSGGPPGLWEELVRFLPRLPGELRGVLLFADSGRAAETAVGESLWISGKLDILYAAFPRTPPSLWFAATGMENFPGGKRMIEKIAASGDGGRLLLNDALGVISPEPGMRISGQSFVTCMNELRQKITAYLLGCDSGCDGNGIAAETFLLRGSLADMTHSAEMHCISLSKTSKAVRAPLGGVFLCGAGMTATGPAFAAALPRSVIPGRSRQVVSLRPNKTWYSLAWCALACVAAGLCLAYFQGKSSIDAIPFELLDPSPNPGSFGGSPPVARYARAREELDALKNSHHFARKIYAAPDIGLDIAERMFANSLESWLPDTAEAGLTHAWLNDLADWAERRNGVRRLTFASLSDRVLAVIRGAHSRRGRMAAARLLADWRELLDPAARHKTDALLEHYDRRLYADWRSKGRDILAQALATAEGDDFALTIDYIASDPGFTFIVKAGEELDFDAARPTGWAKAAIAVTKAHRAFPGQDAQPESQPWPQKISKAFGDAEPAPATPELGDRLAAAAQRLGEYKSSLAEIYPRCLDQAALAQLAADSYRPPGGNPPPATLVQADSSRKTMENAFVALDPVFSSGEGAEALSLVGSGYVLSLRAATFQAAKLIQREWEKTLLSPLSSLDNDSALVFLLDKKPLDVFLEGAINPFLSRENACLVPAVALDQTFPILPSAVDWLNQARITLVQLDREYPIHITLLPVTTDKSASIFPRGVGIEVQTAEEPFVLVGYNNKVSAPFTWSARTCRDVVVSVYFDSFTHSKKYPGITGMIRFLQDLDRGRLVMPSPTFLDRRQELERCGIHSITAHFQITDKLGAGAINTTLPTLPPRLFSDPLYRDR